MKYAFHDKYNCLQVLLSLNILAVVFIIAVMKNTSRYSKTLFKSDCRI